MAKLDVAPTKSSLLALRQQLELAEEGYDLLEQKRQILLLELMSRLQKAREAELAVASAMAAAFAALRDATMDLGAGGIDRAALAVRMEHRVELSEQRASGLKVPKVAVAVEPPSAQFGLLGTSASTDVAMRRFVELLPRLAQLAEIETAVIRLARQLRKTQRRCNALSRTVIPDHRETIDYIVQALEERERESLVILKMTRNRLAG